MEAKQHYTNVVPDCSGCNYTRNALVAAGARIERLGEAEGCGGRGAGVQMLLAGCLQDVQHVSMQKRSSLRMPGWVRDMYGEVRYIQAQQVNMTKKLPRTKSKHCQARQHERSGNLHSVQMYLGRMSTKSPA